MGIIGEDAADEGGGRGAGLEGMSCCAGPVAIAGDIGSWPPGAVLFLEGGTGGARGFSKLSSTFLGKRGLVGGLSTGVKVVPVWGVS